jgi:nicotinamide mononucleotide (NMN) deamidase PncC
MVIRTDEILSILSKLSDESGLKVTVQESVKGGVVAGTACTIGGVLLGPPGLAIGGTVVTTDITTTLIQISPLFHFGFFSKTNHQMMI